MPIAQIRGASINYEILGERGPWVALNPGGRRAMDAVRPLAEMMVAAGYRVLIHDRRNCGASDVMFEGDDSEYGVWVDDLHELLKMNDALPAAIGGFSSGCRQSILFALRYPKDVWALLLWRVTGGPFAAKHLADLYYGQFMRAAERGGMQAVCEMEHFQELIAANPANRDRLLAMDPKTFIEVMKIWSQYFLDDADLPVIGASEDQLRSIKAPTAIIPGDDRVHPRQVGYRLQTLIADSELHDFMKPDLDVDVGDIEEWYKKYDQFAAVFVALMDKAQAKLAKS
ncbi:MAG: alpha/beta fold hydrolase [Alphaproteobacteria bacterium]